MGRVLLITFSRALGPIDLVDRCLELAETVDAFEAFEVVEMFDRAEEGVAGSAEGDRMIEEPGVETDEGVGRGSEGVDAEVGAGYGGDWDGFS